MKSTDNLRNLTIESKSGGIINTVPARDPPPDSVSGMKLIALIVVLLFSATIFASAVGSEDSKESKDEVLSGNITYSNAYQNSGSSEHHDTGNLQLDITRDSKETFVFSIQAAEVIILSSSASLAISYLLIEAISLFDCPTMVSLWDSLIALGFFGLFVWHIQLSVFPEGQELLDLGIKFETEWKRIGVLGSFSFFLGHVLSNFWSLTGSLV